MMLPAAGTAVPCTMSLFRTVAHLLIDIRHGCCRGNVHSAVGYTCVSGSYSDQHGAAVVRTMDGRIQHIKVRAAAWALTGCTAAPQANTYLEGRLHKHSAWTLPHLRRLIQRSSGPAYHLQEGQLVYEASGLPHDCCPIAMTGDGRVVLAATSSGSITSIGWPKQPELSTDAGEHSGVPADDLSSTAGAVKAAQAPPPPVKLDLHGAGAAFKQLSVQVDAANTHQSPRGSSIQSGSSTARQRAADPNGRAAQPQASNTGTEGNRGPGRHEYRLHASRITAIKILHHAGVMFTAR